MSTPKGICNPETKYEAEISAMNAGYVRSPNNIYSVNGSEWYPGCEGLPELRPGKVFITDPIKDTGLPQDKWPVALYFNKYGEPCALSLAMRFASFASFIEYAKENGVLSQPSMPAFLFGD